MDDIISVRDLNLYYGEKHALHNINMDIKKNTITALIGPSGCGKSTFLKCLNRMNDLIDYVNIEGTIKLNGKDIYSPDIDVTKLRKEVGMVFQQPNPFPMSIYDNIAYGPRVHGIKNRKVLDEIVETSLKQAYIFEEVKDILHKSALSLSGGQQQRICIARALAVKPEVLLMDEPTSALDPISTAKIEELMEYLKKDYTVVVVTHNMQQALRVSDYTAFFLLGEMANMIQITIKEAMDIFFEGDIDKAKQIIQNDQEINNYQKKIEQICYSLLIEQQPVASDLRLITAALKMVTDLERIGDQASDICELVIDMKDEKRDYDFDKFKQMYTDVSIMLLDSINSYVNKDKELAKRIIEMDDLVDQCFENNKEDLINYIQNTDDNGKKAVDLLMVNKYLERIGDHITNVAESVINYL